MVNRWCRYFVWSALGLFAGNAAAQLFKADLLASEWKAVSSAPVCSIVHTIPAFGKAVFTHRVGGGELFYIESANKILVSLGEVKIEALPPPWRADYSPLDIGTVLAVVDNQPIKLSSSQVKRLLEYLEKGFNVAFTTQQSITGNRYNLANGLGSMRIVLEAKNFEPAYKLYQICTGEVTAASVGKREKDIALEKMMGYVKRDAALYSAAINGAATGSASAKEYGGGQFKEQIFSADSMSADWKSSSSAFACSLTHSIPGFGEARLLRKSGNDEIFSIESNAKNIFPAGNTRIDTLPFAWRTAVTPINIGTVLSVEGATPIVLKSTNIAQVVAQLSSDVKVMFTSLHITDKNMNNISKANNGTLRVVLEPRNFAAAYKSYQRCLGELIHYTFADVARLLLGFPEKSQGLTAANKAELTRVARYINADKKILGVLVDAHSDNAEASPINEATSKQYADWVSNYLMAQGISAEKITARSHGEKFPVATNKTDQGRAKNRRVTVRLDTEDTRLERAKNAAERKAALEAQRLNPDKTKVTPDDINEMVEGLDLIP